MILVFLQVSSTVWPAGQNRSTDLSLREATEGTNLRATLRLKNVSKCSESKK